MICFVDYRISQEELLNLINLNLNVIKIPRCTDLYPAIDGHVDIQISILNKDEPKILVHKNIDKYFLTELDNFNIGYEFSNNPLGFTYPENIALNALVIGKYFIHNIKYTDKNLLNYHSKKELITIKQGYSKCSVLPLSNKASITSDKGIYKTLVKLGFDVLLLPPGDINLPGLNYGFIGGVGGMISDSQLALFGDLRCYAYGDEVLTFLKKHNIEPIYLSKGKLNDRGSLYIL